MTTRWSVAVYLILDLPADTQEDAERQARTALRTRSDSNARIASQHVRWTALDSLGSNNTCRPD